MVMLKKLFHEKSITGDYLSGKNLLQFQKDLQKMEDL